MTATTDAPKLVPLNPRSGLSQAVTDSLVVAKRNLIRMARIPEMVIFGLVQDRKSVV